MKSNRLAIISLGLICFSAFLADTAFAKGKKESFVERGHAIVQAVSPSAGVIMLKGNEYHVTAQTEVVNEVGMPAQLSEFEAMQVLAGTPDRKTGTRVYFEADYDHNLLKLRIVREIPE